MKIYDLSSVTEEKKNSYKNKVYVILNIYMVVALRVLMKTGQDVSLMSAE